jgi:hypothetical protein
MEDIFHLAKFDNFKDEKKSDYKTVSAGMKTVGLGGLWATFESSFYMSFWSNF